jgi:hypothetical protein
VPVDGALDLAPGEAAARLHRLVDDLTPREQAMLLRLLEARLPELRARAAESGAADGPRRGRGPGPDRPEPPSMGDINVPPAEPV